MPPPPLPSQRKPNLVQKQAACIDMRLEPLLLFVDSCLRVSCLAFCVRSCLSCVVLTVSLGWTAGLVLTGLDWTGARPGKQVQLLETEIKMLCVKARDIFMQQPILLELEAPIKICGKRFLLSCSIRTSLVYAAWQRTTSDC